MILRPAGWPFAKRLCLSLITCATLICQPNGSGGCIPSYRDFPSLSALAGWQMLRGRLRMGAGLRVER